ncbi:hypothetical protein [Halorussus salinisoli]|uniref:hypothetical protein n=1 Tax=Halorussus salinisoli TaxID=2558242 RepID=UPI0010C1CAC9|nr:hypothetical protein [Halorussus salinisoli]
MSESEHQSESVEEIVNQRWKRTGAGTRVAGAWLAMGSVLFVASLALHPPPSPDLGEFMAVIANEPTQWVLAHWAAALALTLFAITGLLMLTTESRLSQNWWAMTAWALLVVGATWITTTAVAEATVITEAAVAGDTATFEAWQLFAEGKAVGFGFLAVAIAVIAGNEARSTRSVTPVWASWIGAVAGLVAFVGFVVLGLLLGIAVGGLIWLASTIVMSLWTLWFGIALVRSDDSQVQLAEARTKRQRAIR